MRDKLNSGAQDANLHAEHRKRLRGRFMRQGLESFETHNILELLLFYAIPRRDVNELAHQLLRRYGSLSGVFDAELAREAGLSENTVALLKLIPALSRAYMLDRGLRVSALDSFDKIGAYLCDYFIGSKRETTVILPLSADDSPRAPITVAEGSPDCCALDMRRLTECVIRADAASFILAHNHAGSDSEPSNADLSATLQIRNIFAQLGIPLREHYVIAGRGFSRCFLKLADYIT